MGQPLQIRDAAIVDAGGILGAVLHEEPFWRALAVRPENRRPRIMVARLVDRSEGRRATSTWAHITKCSHDTALRDVDGPIARDTLIRGPAGGCGTRSVLIETRP